jgi:protein-S-isoprenylcysteine O-methyltransferase
VIDYLGGLGRLPSSAIGGVVLLVLYGVESEVRFGSAARSRAARASDRGSSLALSLAAAVPIVGFVLAMKATTFAWIPGWLAAGSLPGLPASAWAGVAIGAVGLALRLWAVLTLRERYTRTLVTQEGQAVARDGPYRRVRHPGYLGSLMVLNGFAMSSANPVVLLASLCATIAAYVYRIRAEDRMLVEAFGESYAAYRREVPALIPFVR